MFLYKIENVVNGKKYFGQSTQKTKHRLQEHVSKLRNETHENIHLQRAWIKYGEANFTIEIVKEANNLSELNQLERNYIIKHRTCNREFGYNLRRGGDNSLLAEETKQKISKSKKGISNWTPKSLEKLRIALRGRKHSLKSRLKRSKKMKGYRWSEKQKLQWAKAHRPQGYPVLLSPKGIRYDNIVNMTAFCREHGLNQQTMSRLVNKEKWVKSHHGWMLDIN